MTDSVSNNLDFDELQAFVELVTKDQQSILALGNWDPRWLMLFLVNLANQGIPDGAYLLSKLYSRGLVKPP